MLVILVHIYTFMLDFSANDDYVSLGTSLTFLPGETVGSSPACVRITILNDDIVENEEMFSVILSSSSIIQPINITSINVTIYEDSSDGIEKPLLHKL